MGAQQTVALRLKTKGGDDECLLERKEVGSPSRNDKTDWKKDALDWK